MNTQTLLSIVADQREELLANDYSELCRRPEESQFDLKSNMAQVVIGVRRCGKSTLCEMFLKEVFKKGSIESLDQETLFTIQKFFENNLNVSETSRKLFVHRNTLVYRLEKIRKLTGLDLREFDHAIIFKIALMVNKYLKSNPIKY